MTGRGRCPVCSGEFRVKKDGTMGWHNGDVYVGGWLIAPEVSGES